MTGRFKIALMGGSLATAIAIAPGPPAWSGAKSQTSDLAALRDRQSWTDTVPASSEDVVAFRAQLHQLDTPVPGISDLGSEPVASSLELRGLASTALQAVEDRD